MNIGKYSELYSEELRFKNYSENTIKNYVSQLVLFLKHFDVIATKPSEINENQIKSWLMKANTINSRKHRLSSLKLFYKFVVKQSRKFKNIEYPRGNKSLPIVLSQDEVQRMFNVCENIKHKAMLSLLYSCGIRVSELINLKWSHIDRSRMIINIIKGKGNKDRQVMLSEKIIPLLEKYWKEYKSNTYVFNGQKSLQYSERSVGEVIKKLAIKSNISKRVYTHLMRHNCFTHMVESGTDINLIQKLAGHNNVKTTMIYIQISDNLIKNIQSPINNINFY